jgi:hypothetical protein
MSKYWKVISSVVAGIIALAGLIFGVSEYEQKFARADQLEDLKGEVITLSYEVKFKFLSDRLHDIEKRLWYLEQEFGGRGVPSAPAGVKEDYFKLAQEKRQIERQLDALKGD